MQRWAHKSAEWFFRTKAGYWFAMAAAKALSHGILSRRTSAQIKKDILRLRARLEGVKPGVGTPVARLHFGCGTDIIPGFVNVDLQGPGEKVDIAAGRLPWRDSSCEAAVGRHVIEHLELTTELIPFLRDLHRVLKPGGEIWLSCPDMAVICRAYGENRSADLVEDRISRWGEVHLREFPPQQIVNVLFHQDGEHQNLFDFDLLKWVLGQTGFRECERFNESAFLKRFPEFPARNDDRQSLYVRAIAG